MFVMGRGGSCSDREEETHRRVPGVWRSGDTFRDLESVGKLSCREMRSQAAG